MFLAKRMAAVSKVVQSWNITTATYHSASASIGAPMTGALQGMTISADGTKIYAGQYGPNVVYQYTLGTPWDLSTLSYASKSLTVSGLGSLLIELVISPDGAKLYAAMYGRYVHQYTLSTPWDLTTASLSASLNMTAQMTADSLLGFTVSATGHRLYIAYAEGGLSLVHQWDLSTPFDLTTATYVGFLNTASQITKIDGVGISPNGQFLYASASGLIYQYSLGTFFEVSTASPAGLSKNIDTLSVGVSQPIITDSGRKLFTTTNTKLVYRYTMT